MDSIIGIKGKDFVIIAADTFNAYSVLKMKHYDDKIWNLDGQKLLAIGGQHSDVLVFGDYIQKNLAYLEYKNGVKLSIDDTANFIRHQLAQAIRKGPYQVNCLLAGFEGIQPRLYWLDYFGTAVQLTKAAHGYAQFLTSSIMDTLQTKNMTQQEGLNVIDNCLRSMKQRFLMTQTSFTVKVITKDGIKIIRAPEVPKGGA